MSQGSGNGTNHRAKKQPLSTVESGGFLRMMIAPVLASDVISFRTARKSGYCADGNVELLFCQRKTTYTPKNAIIYSDFAGPPIRSFNESFSILLGGI